MCKYCDKSFKADDILKHMIRTHGKIPVRFTSEEYEHLEEIVGNDTSVSCTSVFNINKLKLKYKIPRCNMTQKRLFIGTAFFEMVKDN